MLPNIVIKTIKNKTMAVNIFNHVNMSFVRSLTSITKLRLLLFVFERFKSVAFSIGRFHHVNTPSNIL